MQRKIIGYFLDEEENWVADLDCGHTQHVRHTPPWQERPWVTTEKGREDHVGHTLYCKKCDEELEAVVGQ